jgi:hypothetical protein
MKGYGIYLPPTIVKNFIDAANKEFEDGGYRFKLWSSICLVAMFGKEDSDSEPLRLITYEEIEDAGINEVIERLKESLGVNVQ